MVVKNTTELSKIKKVIISVKRLLRCIKKTLIQINSPKLMKPHSHWNVTTIQESEISMVFSLT